MPQDVEHVVLTLKGCSVVVQHVFQCPVFFCVCEQINKKAKD